MTRASPAQPSKPLGSCASEPGTLQSRFGRCLKKKRQRECVNSWREAGDGQTLTVQVDLLEHSVNLRAATLIPELLHDGHELRDGDAAIAIVVEHGEGHHHLCRHTRGTVRHGGPSELMLTYPALPSLLAMAPSPKRPSLPSVLRPSPAKTTTDQRNVPSWNDSAPATRC